MNELENLEQLEKEFKECRPVLTAIGDETRQLIIISLMKGTYPGMRVGEITKRTNLSRPAVSHHLKILKDLGESLSPSLYRIKPYSIMIADKIRVPFFEIIDNFLIV